MKYRKKEFEEAVSYYRKTLKPAVSKGNACLVEIPFGNEKAFFSLAPLSRALHLLGADVSVFVTDRESLMLKTLRKTWLLNAQLKGGKKNARTKALERFIKTVERKTKSSFFHTLFREPDLQVSCNASHFYAAGIKLDFRANWLKKRLWKKLLDTAGQILKQGYGVKKTERLSIGFDLVPSKKELKLPLEDYLDSYSIAYTFALKAKKLCTSVSLGADTSRKSQLEPMPRTSDLAATIIGCEYEKNINEPWFKAFRKLSPVIEANTLKFSDLSFGIAGQGYGGKHFFGMKIGYPTPNKKSRWQSPGAMLLKPWWYDQTKVDSRPARKRLAITATLPLENYVRTCNIDFFKLRERNEKIRERIKKCVKLFAKGQKMPQGRTDLALDTSHLFSGKSPVLTSDIEVNPKTRGEAAKAFKVKAGRYGNFPGGEVFFTPHKMDGTFVGDVVINIDKSYVIPEKNPMVVSVKDGHYRLLKASPEIKKAFNQRKKESWKLIGLLEKSKSMPKKLIKSQRRNFDRVGEFAVNTNPKARLSRYLIETEKLAKMMHIALGSGYEPGRETTYHMDIVINAPRQKIDLWGVDKKGCEHWIIRKGQFVV
jgi:hypothetical protein